MRILENSKNIETLCDAGDYSSADALLGGGATRTCNSAMTFRSALMLSAQNVKHLGKIRQLEADCIMLNLEDGVSEALKPKALRLCAAVLKELPSCEKKLVVRVNALGEGGEAEIAYLNAFMPDAIRIPKVRSVADVRRALELVDEPIELHLSVETREAWLALSDLACEARVKAMYLGILDLFAELGLSQAHITPENPTLRYMLSHFLVTCKAIGVKPVSFVYQDYRNDAGFEAWLQVEKAMGFAAKGCIAPAQVALVHRYLGFSAEEIARAKEIVHLFEAQRDLGITGFTHETYGFIDEPIYKGALAILG